MKALNQLKQIVWPVGPWNVISLILVAALAWHPEAFAGVNSDGALVFHIDPEQAFSTANCRPQLEDCEGALVSGLANDKVVMVWLFAAFPSRPSVSGVQFGIEHNATIVDSGICGDFAVPSQNWPNSYEGLAVTWGEPMDDDWFPICWFAVQAYDGTSLGITYHPNQGTAAFADDSLPSVLDDVEEYGVAGFGVVGYNPCVVGLSFGACCLPEPVGGCIITTESACEVQAGVYLGDDEACQDYLCAGVCCIDNECVQLTFEECERDGGFFARPASNCGAVSCIREDASWGVMKHVYRDPF